MEYFISTQYYQLLIQKTQQLYCGNITDGYTRMYDDSIREYFELIHKRASKKVVLLTVRNTQYWLKQVEVYSKVKLSSREIKKFHYLFNTILLCEHHASQLTEEFILSHIDICYWDILCKKRQFTEAFIETYGFVFGWPLITQYQILSEEFIERHKDNIFWLYVAQYQTLSEEFMERHINDIKWRDVFMYQKLSEKFMMKYSNRAWYFWDTIATYQELSEEFMETYKDKLDPKLLKAHQRLYKDN